MYDVVDGSAREKNGYLYQIKFGTLIDRTKHAAGKRRRSEKEGCYLNKRRKRKRKMKGID